MSKWSTVRQMTWKVTTTQSPFKVQSLPNTGPLRWIYPQKIQQRKKPAQPLRRPLRLDKAWFTKSRDWEDTSVEISVCSDQSCALTSYPYFVYIIFIQAHMHFIHIRFSTQPQTRTHFEHTNLISTQPKHSVLHQIQLYYNEQPWRHWFRFLR